MALQWVRALHQNQRTHTGAVQPGILAHGFRHHLPERSLSHVPSHGNRRNTHQPTSTFRTHRIRRPRQCLSVRPPQPGQRGIGPAAHHVLQRGEEGAHAAAAGAAGAAAAFALLRRRCRLPCRPAKGAVETLARRRRPLSHPNPRACAVLLLLPALLLVPRLPVHRLALLAAVPHGPAPPARPQPPGPQSLLAVPLHVDAAGEAAPRLRKHHRCGLRRRRQRPTFPAHH